MSPRVKPRTPSTYTDHLDEQVRQRAAAEQFAHDRDEALERAARDHGLAGGGRAPSPYGVGSERSFFLDLVWAAGGEEQLRGQVPPPIVGSSGEARARLTATTTKSEYRDLTTTSTQGGGFVPTGPPAFIGEAFAEAARASSVMSATLPVEPLSDKGMTLKTPRIVTGASTSTAAENTAVAEVDITESLLSNPIATVSGQQDLSQQLFDRSDPAMVDVVLARELGRSLGASFDAQVIAGIGSAGQMLGLRAVTGIASNAYTDVSPTQAEAFPVVNKTYADVATALGATPTLILMHPRRYAWFVNWKDTATGAQSPLNFPAPVVQVPAIGTTYGASTNEDEIYVLGGSELPIYASAPVFRVSFDFAGSATLTARFTAYQYVGALFTRRPEAIGKIAGTGFTPPAWT